jgi:WD domain, G-beta repeat/CobQ/CobB/MinD/ParA nucleotide binding domain
LNEPGTIITFYSYKGGTGRSMALANIAWILAAAGKRVLMIDWDLEAPGLHRYFRPFLIDPDLSVSNGVIDLALQYATEAVKPSAERGEDWLARLSDVRKYTQSIDFDFPGAGLLDLIPAGRQNDAYAVRVSTFNWQNFYQRLGGSTYIDALRESLRRNYDYVLVDSRTGVSDTAGICTVQFPDLLAVCFTYNNQSSEGTAGIASSVYRQRVIEKGDKTFRIVPLPMRIDPFESAKLDARRVYAWSLFAPLVPWQPEGERRAYWLNVEVPYFAALAYEELLATFRDDPSDPKSVLSAFVRTTGYLTSGTITSFRLLSEPVERDAVLTAFASTSRDSATPVAASAESAVEAAIRRAERAYGNLDPERQRDARRFWLRLVRVTGEDEAGFLSPVRVTATELGDVPGSVTNAFIEAGVVTESSTAMEVRFEVTDEALTREWPRLREWATEARSFLFWRQQIRTMMDVWLRAGRRREMLVPEWVLKASEGPGWTSLETDLNAAERDFLDLSQRALRSRQIAQWVIVAAASLAVVLGILSYRYREKQHLVTANREAVRRIVDAAASSTDALETNLLLAELTRLDDPKSPDLLNNVMRLAARIPPRTVIRTGTTFVLVRFSPSGRKVLTGTGDGKLIVWNIDGEELATLRRSNEASLGPNGERRYRLENEIGGVVFSTEDAILAALPGRIRRWSISGDTTDIPNESAKAPALTYARVSGEVIEIGDNHITVRDPAFGKVVRTSRMNIGDISAWAITPDGSRLAVTSGSSIELWDVRSGKLLMIDNPRAVTLDVAIAPPETVISMSISTIRSSNPSRQGRDYEAPEGPTAADVNGEFLGTGALDGVGRLRSLDALDVVEMELRGHRGRINSVKFSPDGKLFATGSTDGTVRIWPVLSRKQVPAVPHDWRAIGPFFRSRTTACLTAEQRAQLLGESQSAAATAYQRCEAEHGRTAKSTTSVQP